MNRTGVSSMGKGVKGSDSLPKMLSLRFSVQPCYSSLLLNFKGRRRRESRHQRIRIFALFPILVPLLKITQIPALTYQALC